MEIWEEKLLLAAKALGVALDALPKLKSAPEKIWLAAVLKAGTSTSNGWLAARLQIGEPTACEPVGAILESGRRDPFAALSKSFAKSRSQTLRQHRWGSTRCQPHGRSNRSQRSHQRTDSSPRHHGAALATLACVTAIDEPRLDTPAF